jgi:hypothetical protein
MIRLDQLNKIQFEVPNSVKGSLEPLRWSIVGMHSFLITRNALGVEFVHEMPVNSGLFYPGIVDLNSQKRVDDYPFDNWYLSSFESCIKTKKFEKVNIEIQKNRELIRSKKVILNTIDVTYGHALLQLFNASYYLKDDSVDLIIVVQKSLEWVVPKNAAQVWVVDIGFKDASVWHVDLENQLFKAFGIVENLYLARSFGEGDESDFDIESFTRVKPFNLNEWDLKLHSKPTITFITRKDRFWKPMLPRFIYNRFTLKLFPRILNKFKFTLQHNWIIRYAESLKDVIPNLEFAVVGMDDNEFKLPDWIVDLRYPEHDTQIAIKQCAQFSKSHIVVGCNGSSLILPSAHAGAVLNISPDNHWSVCIGSFFIRGGNNIADVLFRYQLLPPEIRVKRLVNITVSLLCDRSFILLESSKPWANDSCQDDFFYAKERMAGFKNVDLFKFVKHSVTQKR